MKDGICPKCGSDNVFISMGRDIVIEEENSEITVDDYICLDCGLTETYVWDTSLDELRQLQKQVESLYKRKRKRKNDE